MTKKLKAYRQGDVVIKQFKGKLPETTKPTENKILAYGEVTGHAHRLKGDAIVFADLTVQPARNWIKSLTGFEVEHEEHETIKFPPGVYEYNIQKEYDWMSEEMRRTAD